MIVGFGLFDEGYEKVTKRGRVAGTNFLYVLRCGLSRINESYSEKCVQLHCKLGAFLNEILFGFTSGMDEFNKCLAS